MSFFQRTARHEDLLEGSLADKMILFALPLAASSVLQQLFNAADLAVVGRFASSRAMAAVGSNASVINLIISLFVGLSVGANVLIASMIGSGHKRTINAAVHTVISVALIAGVFLVFAGILISRPVLHLMGAPTEVMELATLYLRIYFLGMPAVMMYNFGSAILRSKGDSARPLYALMLSGVINIILNLIFVVIFHLHVIGVAAATVISNLFGAGLIVFFLMHEEEPFTLYWNRLGIRLIDLKKMAQIGLPAGFQGAVFSLSNVVIQSSVNSFGASAMAGATAVQNFDFVSYCVINAFAQTTVTFIGQNYAARNEQRCRKIFRIAMLCGLGTSVLVVTVLVLLRYPFIHIFTADEEVIAFAMKRVMSCFVFHYLIGTYEISGGCLRGMNHSLVPAVIAVVGTCLFRLLYVFLYVSRSHTFETLFHVYPISWILTGTVTLTAYFLISRKEYERMRQL